MALIEGEIVFERPVEEVFDYVADQRHEPRFNSRMRSSELLTAEPIGAGSRFRADLSVLGRPVELIVEFTAFERPRRLGSRSWSQPRGGRGKPMIIEGEPLAAWLGRRQERRIWSELKRLLEAGAVRC